MDGMSTATYAALCCLILVVVILGMLPLIRDRLVERRMAEKKLNDYARSLGGNYEEAQDVVGLCSRCMHLGRPAELKAHRNKRSATLIVLYCPSCGSLFQVNLAANRT